MRVKMLVGLAGGLNLSPGDIYDAPEDEALRLISARYALPYSEPLVEVATKPRARERRKAD